MGNPVASVVIPCYNAERWVGEAIESCLSQTYPRVEIIAVDDGSTDGSAEILRSYGGRIHLVSGRNRGGNHARNRGFALSQGEYIQFLDADDYLLPEKLERQVAFLEQSGADVVYGDWRHQFHELDGSSYLGDVQISGHQEDVLESLLEGWWVANNALLFRRQVVIDSGGWDEALMAAQDRDLFTMVALRGSDIRYQAGCYSVYRRHGGVSTAAWTRIGSKNHVRWLESHRQVLEKVEALLVEADRLAPCYRRALAKSYFSLARNYYDLDRAMYRTLVDRTLSLHPGFEPNESPFYNSAWRLLGFETADKLASYRRRLFRRGEA